MFSSRILWLTRAAWFNVFIQFILFMIAAQSSFIGVFAPFHFAPESHFYMSFCSALSLFVLPSRQAAQTLFLFFICSALFPSLDVFLLLFLFDLSPPVSLWIYRKHDADMEGNCKTSKPVQRTTFGFSPCCIGASSYRQRHPSLMLHAAYKRYSLLHFHRHERRLQHKLKDMCVNYLCTWSRPEVEGVSSGAAICSVFYQMIRHILTERLELTLKFWFDGCFKYSRTIQEVASLFTLQNKTSHMLVALLPFI